VNDNPSQPLAIITGASRGIGRATATRLAQAGYRTLLVARDGAALGELAQELSAHAPSHALPLDLTQHDRIAPALAEALQTHGPCAALINNAGSGHFAPSTDWSRQDHQRMFDLHYLAAVELIQAVLPAMRERRRGHVINVCSIATRISPWGHSGYTAAKSALEKLTQTLHAELAPEGLAFTSVHPALIDTDFFDQPAYEPLRGQVRRHAVPPQRVAVAIERILRRRHPPLHAYVPGYYRLISGLSHIAPRLTHGLLARQSKA